MSKKRGTTDYIKREDALNFIENGIYMDTEPTEYTIKRFNNAVPSADVVEVVRCKDCKFFAGEGMYCEQDIIVKYDHFYCYYAERREE